jgi:hypothetical protein
MPLTQLIGDTGGFVADNRAKTGRNGGKQWVVITLDRGESMGERRLCKGRLCRYDEAEGRQVTSVTRSPKRQRE